MNLRVPHAAARVSYIGAEPACSTTFDDIHAAVAARFPEVGTWLLDHHRTSLQAADGIPTAWSAIADTLETRGRTLGASKKTHPELPTTSALTLVRAAHLISTLVDHTTCDCSANRFGQFTDDAQRLADATLGTTDRIYASYDGTDTYAQWAGTTLDIRAVLQSASVSQYGSAVLHAGIPGNAAGTPVCAPPAPGRELLEPAITLTCDAGTRKTIIALTDPIRVRVAHTMRRITAPPAVASMSCDYPVLELATATTHQAQFAAAVATSASLIRKPGGTLTRANEMHPAFALEECLALSRGVPAAVIAAAVDLTRSWDRNLTELIDVATAVTIN